MTTTEQPPPVTKLPEEGFVRISLIVGPGRMFPWSRATLYRRIAAGEFPKPIPIGPGMVGWPVDAVRKAYSDIMKRAQAQAA